MLDLNIFLVKLPYELLTGLPVSNCFIIPKYKKMNLKLTKIHILTYLILLNISCTHNDSTKTEKILIDIGDSLTAGAGGDGTTMSNVTAKLLGPEWTVKNMGVGGENTLTIGARQGGLPMYIKESIRIPKDGSKVAIPSGLYSSYNDKKVYPLLQGAAGINPCYIDTIKCNLTREQNKYYINSMTSLDKDYITRPKSKIITALSKQTKGIATIFIGQNGGYDSPEDFMKQLDLIVKHKGDENIIIITSHGKASKELREMVRKKYGRKHIDLKKYMTTKAIYDAIKFGLLPNNGQYPTAKDLNDMKNNKAPTSLLYDGIHFNAIGYELLGRLRYQKGKELGYW